MTRHVRWCVTCGAQPCHTHCIYCHADCAIDEPAHLPYCPTTIGMWPTSADEHCTRCGHRCGDLYATTPDPDTDGCVLVICLPCATSTQPLAP